jgi:hypothetical protein
MEDSVTLLSPGFATTHCSFSLQQSQHLVAADSTSKPWGSTRQLTGCGGSRNPLSLKNRFRLGRKYDTLSPAVTQRNSKEPPTMEWVTPQHEEIDLNCEISSYANAEL